MTSEEKKENIPSPDWTIGDLYSKAWQIIKHNKILWIFGAAIGGANYSGSADISDLFRFSEFFEKDADKGKEIAAVLGAAATNTEYFISLLFASVPIYLWIILAIEFILLIVVSIIIGIIYKSWANGALLVNIDLCIKGSKATIREASEKAFTLLKPLIWLDVIPALILTIITIFSILIMLFAVSNCPTPVLPIIIFILFLVIASLGYAWIMLYTTLIWATRKVVTENTPAKIALTTGYKIAKKKFWATLLLAFVNNLLAALIIGVPLALVMVILIGGLFSSAYAPGILFYVIIIINILIFIFIVAATVAGGIINAFKATVWSLAYQNIKGKYETR
jgi:hypothetical protein